MNGSERTFLKVFIAVSDDAPNRSLDDRKSSDSDKRSSVKGRQRSVQAPSPTSNAQYTIVTISAQSTASDVCAAVARKRNLPLEEESAYELVMCDGDGQASYQKILAPEDKPHQHQQSAAKHGHLGDFHFVFRAGSDDADSGSENDSEGDSEPDMFGALPQQIKHGKYPASYLEKRGKTHRAWRRRYFVLIENELLYYRRRDVYENHKEPIARIELVNPPGIVKILPPETQRKSNTTSVTYFHFDIHTPRRVYSLRSDNYEEMVFWVKALSRRNEPNELMDGIDVLLATSEGMHSEFDEQLMDRFSSLASILGDKEATDAYLKYLQSQHNQEFILFWLDVGKYISDFDASDDATRSVFAAELYGKYIESGARYELSDLKSEFRRTIQHSLSQGVSSKDMFDQVQQSVFEFLDRDSFKFFTSSEYFRFIVTYKPSDSAYQDMFTWPPQFEHTIDAQNSEKHRYILSSTQNLIHSHSKHGQQHSYHSTMSMMGAHSVHSPVLNRKATHKTGGSPALKSKSVAKLSFSDTPAASSNENGKEKSSHHQKKKPPLGAVQSQPPPQTQNQLSAATKKKRRPYGQSVFDDAPGLNHNTK